ncbi:MAG: acyl-CoA dehydrogenase [Sphingomonadaceae bacterium]|uniref:acyl-CoA dehydrogenase family protein n=1 Tax=Thermaurantiacus sp. TaxID=2820283 RepID=UPI00298EF909|nr:acyl-CoA dehydrogenase [Thermaurantiacus sp.]MCS6987154.1 acyl-CoA dehydrogenase [Sphingomonadaceae bacterium]MDW8415812.1 acyl-CoA dehydrogenase [Thermaurantiacus sp.]
MNFDWSDEQALMRATIERFGDERGGLDRERRRRQRALPGGFDRDGWAELGRLGVLALPFAASAGGLGGGPVDLVAAAEPVGAKLLLEPVSECAVMAGTLLEAAGSAHLAHLMAGRHVPAAALLERGGRWNLAHVATRAERRDGRWILSGAKSAVWQGGAADLFVVSARLEGDVRDTRGVALFAVPAERVRVRTWAAADGSLAAELELHEAEAERLETDAWAALEAARTRFRLAAAAEMLGIARMLFAATLDYVKGRVQFGQPIGRFQAVQHRLVDAHVALEQAQSLLWRAAIDHEPRLVAGMHAYVAEAAIRVAHEAVQFHGGMGVTDELVVGHGLKRIRVLAAQWGDATMGLDRFLAAA